jgi:basic membrane protein A
LIILKKTFRIKFHIIFLEESMKKTSIRLLAILGLILMLPGFLFAKGNQQQGAQTKSGNVVKIALIIENTIDDKGWCQAMHDGIKEAQKQLPGRIEYSYSEKMLPVDAGSAARQYAAQGYNIIIGHGAQYKNLILEMAEEFPDVTFAFGTSAEVGPANVFTYMPESEETGYINGVIAGLSTKTNIIGYVGPVDGGDAARYGRGFVLGVPAVNPQAKVMVAHTGSFSDFVKAGEVAHTQIRANADLLTGASQQAIGALRAVSDAQYSSRDLWWLGQDLAQFATPEGKAKCIAASSYNYAAVIVGFVQKFDAGIRGGECIPMNFHNGGFVFEYNADLGNKAPVNIKAKVDEALVKFRSTANTLNWNAVDYSKL